jgi:hypothetical protein
MDHDAPHLVFVSSLSLRNRATFEANNRPKSDAKRNHSRNRKKGNSKNKIPVLSERRWSGLGGGPNAFLRLMSLGESEWPYAVGVHS